MVSDETRIAVLEMAINSEREIGLFHVRRLIGDLYEVKRLSDGRKTKIPSEVAARVIDGELELDAIIDDRGQLLSPIIAELRHLTTNVRLAKAANGNTNGLSAVG